MTVGSQMIRAQQNDPTLDEISALAERAWTALPSNYRSLCADLIIRVEELPPAYVLRDLGIEDPLELLGLYSGIGLPEKSVDDSGALPDMVFLYRAPIIHFWRSSDIPLFLIVRHVLVHEIGHHFGLSDEDMEAIDTAEEP